MYDFIKKYRESYMLDVRKHTHEYLLGPLWRHSEQRSPKPPNKHSTTRYSGKKIIIDIKVKWIR